MFDATNHYLNQCWPSCMTPYDVSRGQKVKEDLCFLCCQHKYLTPRHLGSFLCLRLQAPEALCFRVVCPSVHPSEAWNNLFSPVHGSVGPTDRFAACPSVCPSVRRERFPSICQRMHGGNGLKFCMLMYLGHLQNWLDYGDGLLIFHLLASLSCRGVYWFHSFCPSVRPSVPHPLCSTCSSSWIHFIFTYLIKQLQKVCHM